MKKILLFIITTTMIIVMIPTVVFAENISVTVDGVPIVFPDQHPLIQDGRTLVPVAPVFHAMGYTTQWWADANPPTVFVTGNDNAMQLFINEIQFSISHPIHIWEYHSLDVPPQIMNGRTMLPLAQPLRALGYNVNWNTETRTVEVTRPAAPFIIPGEEETDELEINDYNEINEDEMYEEDNEDITIQNDTYDNITIRTRDSVGNYHDRIININTTFLDLAPRSINCLSFVSYLNYLGHIRFVAEEDIDLYPLSDLISLTSITILGVNEGRITDLRPLSKLPNLTHLNLRNLQIYDISPISEMTNLRRLDLRYNLIYDLTPLADLPYLNDLDLRGNIIVDWTPVDHINYVSGRPVN